MPLLWGLILGVGALLAGGWLWSRAQRYGAIFHPACVRGLRDGLSALRMQARAFPGEGEPPHVVVGGDLLLLVYTMHEEDDGRWVHHLSLSTQRGPTPQAVGRTFLLMAGRLLRWPEERVHYLRGRSGVFHASVLVSAEEHGRLLGAPIPPLEDDHAALRLQRDCVQAAHGLTVEDA